MGNKVYDVAAVVGTKQDGKPRWKTFGAVFKTDRGLSMKLDGVPLAKDFDGWFTFFEPRQDNRRQSAPKPQADPNDPNDEIPF